MSSANWLPTCDRFRIKRILTAAALVLQIAWPLQRDLSVRASWFEQPA